MKKHAFTLMELMIALSLAVIVLGVIFSSLYQNSVLNVKQKNGAAIVMQKVHIQERLDQIFANISDKEKQSIYTDKKGDLHFQFDHGIDPEPEFCGMICGKLEHCNGDLVLSLMGDEKVRSECLCPNVETLNCEFLTHDGHDVQTTDAWPEEEAKKPLYLKLSIDDESYIFWINHQGMEIPLK
ncbi:PilW family protein [Candidatus Neptunichlamydia sp. REUL1]|uniref:PilW family protein n=1 Tax=Candidatus Neptunichlamydia sp. REUL1 TaxID=3064277 RepID=UPI00292EE5DB|nr:prepilin-type N-terminal cleavage/methylation domain-containing protein [Candidatus Neptunochlamydia sp. REUL1]